jgi:hypothetical protein
MNIQLVETLANAIKALSPEERELLDQKLTDKYNWQNLRQRILTNAQAIQQRRDSQSMNVDVQEIIHDMREERDQQLLADLSPSEEKL